MNLFCKKLPFQFLLSSVVNNPLVKIVFLSMTFDKNLPGDISQKRISCAITNTNKIIRINVLEEKSIHASTNGICDLKTI